MEKIKKHSPLLILGLFFLGVCMRMPITAIPSVIKDIAQTFNVETTSLGILTTIPLLCFGLLSSVVSALAQRIGNELTIELAMILMFIGSYLRILNFSSLMIGTILVGAAITCINVLLPAIISDKLPNQIGSVTGMYNVAMTLFAAIGAYAITPITHTTSWQTAVIIISIVALIAAIIWVPNLRYNQRATNESNSTDRGTNMWKNANAWWLLLFFGGQCFVFYSIVAWLPTIAMDAGLSSDNASLVAGLLQLLSMPFAFAIPVIATKMKNRQPIMLFAGTISLIGTGMMFFPVNSLVYYIFVALFLGAGTTTTFVLAMTLFGLKTKSSTDTRSLSGMVQSVGYLISALGPIVVGNLYSQTHNWFASLIVIAIAAIFFTVCGVIAERKQFV